MIVTLFKDTRPLPGFPAQTSAQQTLASVSSKS